ncbi:Hypothetical predicted protein, partial [Pelobates cultripes]
MVPIKEPSSEYPEDSAMDEPNDLLPRKDTKRICEELQVLTTHMGETIQGPPLGAYNKRTSKVYPPL